MISDLLRRLLAPAPAPLSQLDARLALAALLVRLAKTDGHYAAAEMIQIDTVLATRFALGKEDAIALRVQAEFLEEEAPDTVRFTRALKEAVAYEDRTELVAAMWQVVLADGVRDVEEDALMRTVVSLLGISDQDSNRIRLSVPKP
jgi:uncharacterized tellurite resistance protein B-like protein